MEMCCLTVPEAQRPSCRQGWFLPRAVRERSIAGFSPSLETAVFSLGLHVVFPLCVSVSSMPLVWIAVILDERPP